MSMLDSGPRAGSPSAGAPVATPAGRESLALLEGFGDAMRARLPRGEFLALIDAARDRLHERLADVYGDPYFAKLYYLKASNYVIARYEYDQRHVHLVARPVTLMIDPSNACQLGCPGCVHSANDAFTQALDWPAGTMKLATWETLLRNHGPFALNAVLYNYGEPLLNKRAPEFIERAHGYGMTTHLSTNLSLRFDCERFVAAGPDYVILSIDGLTQQTYGRFRKGGDLALVLDNVRRMVAEKRRLGTTRPRLAWRFFPFEHNVHEVDDVMAAAEEIGVDQLIIGTPFDVSQDDPSVRLTHCDKRGRYELGEARAPFPSAQDLVVRDAHVEALYAQSWSERAAGIPEQQAHPEAGTCVWLYYSMTADAVSRVMPCCISPSTRKPLVYGRLDESGATDHWNAGDFAESRLAFADRAGFEAQRGRPRTEPEPWCASCPKRPPLTYGTPGGVQDLIALDSRDALRAAKFWWSIAEWS